MPRQILKLEGFKELDDALSELPKAVSRNVLRGSLKKEGEPIRAAGEAYAPKLSGELKQSYTIGTKLSRRQKKQNRKLSPVEVYIGPTPHAKSVQTEFGNAHQAAQPHLRPAFDGNVMKVLDGLKATIADKIERARVRLAKKAERLAAQIRAQK